MSNRSLAFIMLVVTAFAGAGVPITKDIVGAVPPIFILFLRFTMASIILFIYKGKHIVKSIKKEDIKPILIVGTFCAGGYILYNLSVAFTTATNAAFFYSVSVLMIPFIAKLVNGTPYNKGLLIGIGITVIGMVGLIFNTGEFSFNLGDLLGLSCAVLFSFHVVFTGRYMDKTDPWVLANLQFVVVSVIVLIVALMFEDIPSIISFGTKEWIPLLYLAFFGTVVIYVAQNFAQTKLTESIIGIIYALIPLFGAISSWIILGETLSVVGGMGAGLMVIGAMVASKLNAHGSKEELEKQNT